MTDVLGTEKLRVITPSEPIFRYNPVSAPYL